MVAGACWEPMHARRPVTLRAIPWLFAVAGLAAPLAGGHLPAWLLAPAWIAGLCMVATGILVAPARARRRLQQIVLGLVLVPGLLLLGSAGGWWLLPADVAWVVIQATDDGHLLRVDREPAPSDPRVRLPSQAGLRR